MAGVRCGDELLSTVGGGGIDEGRVEEMSKAKFSLSSDVTLLFTLAISRRTKKSRKERSPYVTSFGTN